MVKTLLTCIESRVESNCSLYGRFQLGPFQLGQGLTVGNGLRRSMLSELMGIGIIAVEMKEAIHEYSTLKGIQESVFDILLNLKQIGIKSVLPLNSPQIGFLQEWGPATVKACDLKLPPSVQVVDPQQHIATICRDGSLKLKVLIWQGKNGHIQPFSISFQKRKKAEMGLDQLTASKKTRKKKSKEIRKSLSSFLRETFLRFDSLMGEFKTDFSTKTLFTEMALKDLEDKERVIDNKKMSFFEEEKRPSSYFQLDPVLTPIKNVNFIAEVDDNLEEPKDRLILEVWTNGSIKPRDAIYGGAKALIKLFASFQTTLPTGSFLKGGNTSQKHFAKENILDLLAFFNKPHRLNRGVDSISAEMSFSYFNRQNELMKQQKGSSAHFVEQNQIREELFKSFYSLQKHKYRRSSIYSLRLEAKDALISRAQKDSFHFLSFFPSPSLYFDQQGAKVKKENGFVFQKGSNLLEIPLKRKDWKKQIKKKSPFSSTASSEKLCSLKDAPEKEESSYPFQRDNFKKGLKRSQSTTSNKKEKENRHASLGVENALLKDLNLIKQENGFLFKELNPLDIENLDLSLRLFTLLKQANVHTLGDLAQHSRENLLSMKGLNRNFVKEINKKLNKIGFDLSQ